MNSQNDPDNYRDPKYWKLGVFYFNPGDKRLFVPKRISQFGITVNFANPAFILPITGLILLIALIKH
jgi:uncharacterized membrane protein